MFFFEYPFNEVARERGAGGRSGCSLLEGMGWATKDFPGAQGLRGTQYVSRV